jgi:hypothetical protein
MTKEIFLVIKGTFLIIITNIFKYVKNVAFWSYRVVLYFTYYLDDVAALQCTLFNLSIFSLEMDNILTMHCM